MAVDKNWKAAIADAHALLTSTLVRTPVIKSDSIAELLKKRLRESGLRPPSIELFFKCENLQTTGSFKLRGATHFLNKLSDSQLIRGIVAYSTGNHALATACAAQTASQHKNIAIPCTVIMPLTASPYKIAAAKRYGAKVILRGNNTADGALLAHKIVKLQNATLIPPSGDEDIMLGQATVMMEFADQIQDMGHQPLDLVLVPSAGGALLAGTGLICEGSGTLVIGTEPKNGGADLRIARQRGVRQGSINQDFTTIAEGLRSPTADFNWRFLCDSKYVRDVFGVTEDSIKITMRIMVEELKMVVEPSAAVSLSALLFNNDCLRLLSTRSSWRIGIIISGGNISVDKMLGLIQQ